MADKEADSKGIKMKTLRSTDPDLEVVLGAQQSTSVRCYSVLLASYSEYVDTMLASNMMESTTMKISFPDIESKDWQQIMDIHVIGHASTLAFQDSFPLVPILDKYGFRDAINFFDRQYESVLKPENTMLFATDLKIQLAAVSVAHDLVQSKPAAFQFAKDCIFRGVHCDVDSVKLLFEIVQNEEETLRFTLETVMTKTPGTMDEMKAAIKRPSFPAEYNDRLDAISEVEAVASAVKMDTFFLRNAGLQEVHGRYKITYRARPLLGLMKNQFVLEGQSNFEGHERNSVVSLRPTDPFGSKWEFVRVNVDESVQTLYTWDSGYSSTVPPRNGWKLGPHGQEPVPKPDYFLP